MSKINRNDPCPCNSGKKYKHCCLAKANAYQIQLQEQHEALLHAVDWLMKHHEDEIDDALSDDFYNDPEDGRIQESIAALPDEIQLMVLICLHEWILADADLYIDETSVRASDLVLGSGGPLLTFNGRRHLEALAQSHLSLYEIREVINGKGLVLQDILNPEIPAVFVHEESASNQLVQWDMLGTRILTGTGENTLGGGVYPFDRRAALELAKVIAKTIEKERKRKNPVAPQRIITRCIISAWLVLITAPPSIPMFMDLQTGEPILFTTDTYTVADWNTLERVLRAQQDVDKEEDGDDTTWVRIEEVDEERYHSLARLRHLPSGELEVECRTVGRADTARTWLEGLAGAVLTCSGRSTMDPREQLLNKRQSGARSIKKVEETIQNELPLDVQKRIIHKYMAEHYASWVSMPIPALGGKTPMQAAKLKTGRPKVVELLKDIERSEARRAQETGIDAFDISFVWEQLGLTRG